MKKMEINKFSLFLAVFIFLVAIKVINDRFDEIKGILHSSSIEYLKTEGEIIRSGEKRGHKYIEHYDIAYSYRVGGLFYISTTIDFLGDYGSVEKYTSEYPVGKKVLVFYETGNPDFLALKPNEKSFFVFLLPLFFMVCSLGFFWEAFTKD